MGLFKKDKKEENEFDNKSLDRKIDAALRKAQNDKRDTIREIEKIKTWAAEVIIDAYAHLFPNGHLTYYREQYKKDALEKYENIKTDNASKVSPENAEKCDKYVTGYLNQIALRESKLKLFEKLESEYQKTKDKLKLVNAKQEKSDKFKTHSERLNSLDEHAETLGNAMTDTNKLDELKQEFELKSEYINQLEKLTTEYSDESDSTTALAFKDEVEKMITDMDE